MENINDNIKAVVMRTNGMVRYGEVLDVVNIRLDKKINKSKVCVMKNNRRIWLDMEEISLK